MKIHLIGQMPVGWATAHERDHLWAMTVTRLHVTPHYPNMLFRTLDSAIKEAARLTEADVVWFRREGDAERNTPIVSCRTGDGTIDHIVAYLQPVQLGFIMPDAAQQPKGWDKVDGGARTAEEWEQTTASELLDALDAACDDPAPLSLADKSFSLSVDGGWVKMSAEEALLTLVELHKEEIYFHRRLMGEDANRHSKS